MVAKIEHRTRTGCPIACSLDIIGDHWTLLVVRNLMFLDVHEYKDMLVTDEKISSGILSDRLKKLEINGVISAIPHPKSQKRKLYYLTTMGKELVYIMVPLIFWADKHLQEYLNIPDDKRAIMDLGTNAMIKGTLENLKKWENENLYTSENDEG